MSNDQPRREPKQKPAIQDRLDILFANLARFSGKHPLWILLGALLLLGWGFVGAGKVHQDNSMDAYFDESDTSFRYYKQYIEEFSSDEVIYILYSAPEYEHGIFNLEVMKKVDALTKTFERELPFTRKVTSLTNVEFIEADGDDVLIHGMLEDFPESQQDLLEYREIALSKPLYVNSLISADGQYAGIVIEMTRTSTDPLETLRHDPDGGDAMENLYPQVPNTAMKAILAREEFTGLNTWVSGDVPMNATYNEVINADLAVMGLGSILILMPLSMLFIKRRLVGLIAPVAVVGLSVVLIVGLMGWGGWSINLFFMMIPSLIVAVGVAQAVHVILAWEQQTETNRKEALVKAIAKVGTPCLLAAVTTSIGFLGMGVSEMRAISELAVYTAFGIMCTFLLSMTLMITFAARGEDLPPVERDPNSRMVRLNKRLAEINIAHPHRILGIFGGVLLVAFLGVAQLKVDFNFLHEFKASNPWRIATEKMNDTMGGLLSVVYVFNTGEERGVNNAQLLKLIEGAEDVAETSPVVVSTLSVADILKELNQAFHGGDPEWYRLPEDDNALAQLLLVYEVSGGEEMDDVLNFERSKTALQIRLQLVSASKVREFLALMDGYFEQHPQSVANIEVSGIGLLWVRMADYITDTQLKGYSIVFGLIALVMIIAFGSIKTGLLGMIPNLFPIVICLGLMGWLRWDLDYLRLMMATIAIGIAVDDTIHTLTRLRTEFRIHGSYHTAIHNALQTVGPALIATTVILIGAFLTYLLSSMAVMASFGVLLALAIAAALIGDLFLLPALILVLKPFGPEFTPSEGAQTA